MSRVFFCFVALVLAVGLVVTLWHHDWLGALLSAVLLAQVPTLYAAATWDAA